MQPGSRAADGRGTRHARLGGRQRSRLRAAQSPSLSAPATGDADGDTWSDIALVQADRVTLLLSRRRTTTPLAVLVGCAVVAVALVVWSWNKAALLPAMRDVAARAAAAMRGKQ